MLPLITLDIRTSQCTPEHDTYNYYNRYDYEVKLFSDGDDEYIFIGKGVSILYLCEKAINEGFDILDAFAENDSFNFNILVSERLEILPEYQHHGYGKVIRQILRDFFSGCYGVEILHSFPLQLEMFDNNEPWRAQMHYDTMNHNKSQAQASLNRCYLRTGYTQYHNTEYFYRFPSIETLDETEWEEY